MALEVDAATEVAPATEVRPTVSTAKKIPNKYEWKKRPIRNQDDTFDLEFSDPPDEVLSPLTYFKMFVDDECIAHITEQTNMYAMQKDAREIAVTIHEMEQFLSILFVGLFPCPSYRMYWAGDSRFNVVADTMSRNRFETILRYLHFNDNTAMLPRNHAEYDPLFKVRPFLERLRSNMKNVEPEEHHSIDEQIIPFKGCSSLKQYNKNKPHKWGFKVFTRAGVSGMMYDFEVYTGKSMKIPGILGISGNIVLWLLRNLEDHKNLKVYFDNWFTSVDLVKLLKDSGFWVVASIRQNRLSGCQLASDKKLKDNGRGTYDHKSSKEGITIVKWYDSKAVHLISSHYGVEPMGTCKRWSTKEKQHVDIQRPHLVEEYNIHMGGVDLADMLLELYRTDLRSRKWYMRIVYYCLDVAVVNDWLLYRRHMQQRKVAKKSILPLRNFRANIAHALAKQAKLPKKRGRRSSSSSRPAKVPRALRQRMYGMITLPIGQSIHRKRCAASYVPLDSQESSVVNVILDCV